MSVLAERNFLMKKMLFLALAVAGFMLGGCGLCSWFKCAKSCDTKTVCCSHDKKADVVSSGEAEKSNVADKHESIAVNKAESAVEEAV